jgi:hypothetical protein
MKQELDEGQWPSTTLNEVWINAPGKSTKSFYSSSATGKWCIFPTEEEEADELWAKIKVLAEQDAFVLAKSSTIALRHRFPSYVICVYTLDWKNEEDVMRVKDALRSGGIQHQLKYKRDVDTFNNVYGTPDEFIYTDTV